MGKPLIRLMTIVLTCVITLGTAWNVQARSTNSSASLKVVYQQFGPPPYYEGTWWKMAQKQLSKSHVHVQLQPVVASEGDYYTKVDLMMRSASTAPDIVREDSFLVGSDVTAGYLAPLDSCLATWPQYKANWYPKMKAITTFKGHIYGVMNGTDVRLIWYNKNVFKRAGLPTNWQPHNWNDILKAARTIKAKVKGVIPMNLYSGIAGDEASTMQGFEMLLYGTKDPLYDYATKKWVVSGKGLVDSLNFVKTVYDQNNLLGPSNDIALSPQAGLKVSQELLPQNKLGIDIDGSWLPTNWVKGGAHPWPQWNKVLGHAKMPTEFGQAPHYVTLSGGWSYSISARSSNKAAACQALKAVNSRNLLAWYDTHIANIAPRKDELQVASYRNMPLSGFFTSLLNFTQFRPAFPEYPRVSTVIDEAMQNVMSGMSSQDAVSTFERKVTRIVGSSKIEKR
jgi:multiple sugar transport system substrate-binding protein